ncbi:MAG: pyridoxamine kinase, partial [Clostridia bacterium]|nr:pyridoxamine kinase [Clostridia bacterium]
MANIQDKKVLTVQDISCFGQCSLTVALPIISACGIETAILPSAVLSTHTGGFTGWTFRDLTDDIPAIVDHWEKQEISFDAIYTGYLGSKRQIELVKDMFSRLSAPGCLRVVDPAMADNGTLYYGFDEAFAHEMGTLCGKADIALPNITEAAMMTDMPYIGEGYDEAYIRELMEKVLALGAKTVVLTGVSYNKNELGAAVLSRGDAEISYYFHERLDKGCHGTGDIFASAFVGALVNG